MGKAGVATMFSSIDLAGLALELEQDLLPEVFQEIRTN
jgi:hypothetical protein